MIPTYLRRDYKRLAEKPVVSGSWVVVAILVTIFAVAFVLDNLTGLTTVARAAEPEVIHQNDYYCQQIKDTGEEVKGTTDQQLVKLCKSYGVSL